MGKIKIDEKTKKIINTVIMSIEIVIIIVCIVLSAVILFGSKTTTEELGSGKNITAVLSSSMDGNVKKGALGTNGIGSFKKGDLLVIKKIDEKDIKNLKVGDVITYRGNVGGQIQLITHRITKIETVEGIGLTYYYTLGDAQRTDNEINNIALSQKYLEGEIEGIVTKVVPGVGKVIAWFQNSSNFLWAVVIPLALLLAYNLYLFIRMIIDYRIKKIKEQGESALAELKAQSALDEEKIKRKAIEEFLASQGLNEKKEESSENVEITENKVEEK